MKKSVLKVAALQLGSLEINDSRLEYYWRICSSKKIKILLLGEYLLNPFFKEIEVCEKKELLEYTQRRVEKIRELSRGQSTMLFAPVVTFKGGKNLPYKSLLIAQKGELLFYQQQRLMPFEHWNEAQFYGNPNPKNPIMPPLLEIDGFKIAPLFGYEAHFDEFWMKFKKAHVDVALIPSASTFGSKNRWREVLKSRAFLNSCYLLRANRVGEYQDVHGEVWKFYGDSFLVRPNGEIEDYLGDKEELLLNEISRDVLNEIRTQWAFV